MGGDSRSEVRGFESRHLILDGHAFFHIDLLQELYCCLKRSKINKNEARVGSIFLDYYVKFWASDDYAITN